MLNKEQITRGEAEVITLGLSDYKQVCIGSEGSNYVLLHMYLPEHKITPEIEANAAFIADAFNGFNRTGKTYGELEHINNMFELKMRDMFKEIDDLKANLRDAVKALRDIRDFDEDTSNYDDPGEIALECLRLKLKVS